MTKDKYIEFLMGLYSNRGYQIIGATQLSEDYSASAENLNSEYQADERLTEYEKDFSFIAHDAKQYILVYVNAMFVDKKNKKQRKFNDKDITAKQVASAYFISDNDIEVEDKELIFHYIVKDDILDKSAYKFKHQTPDLIKVQKVLEYASELPDYLFKVNYEKKDDEDNSFNVKKGDNKGVKAEFTKTGAKAVGDWGIPEMAKKHHCTQSVMMNFLVDFDLLSMSQEGKVKYYSITEKGTKFGASLKTINNTITIQFPRNLIFDIVTWSKWLLKQTDEKKEAGDDYEKYIGEYYEDEGFFVKYNGLDNGKEDKSTDLIAVSPDNVVYFIQCKNWSVKYCRENNKMIGKNDIVSFEKESEELLETSEFFTGKEIKKVFIMAHNKTFTKEALEYCQDKDDVELKVIPLMRDAS